ncbi:MAG: DUF5107 domain-containing protein [Parabacteroides sp.]|nr:DUF5107 domain-containing protein [Parabacteroides sp.]MEA4839657.1 DUF5107 domain-containing protein [Bacteroidales bacterium]
MKKLLSIVGFGVLAFTAFAQQATVNEKVLNVPTYTFSDPNPVAALSAQSGRPTYPYFRFDGFSAKSVDQDWKVVELENPYIKVSILPQMGGKIWGAIDKTTQKEFIYQNHVMKFRDISMRGPWTSGGIEFNFGIIGHVPTTATPVDYKKLTKEDGSVSCYVSSYEWITDTWWTVEINLPQDKAYFTTNVIWHNASSINQPYYQWMNAAYSVRGNAHFLYPGNASINHDGKWDSFPITKAGRDISWYKNMNFGPDMSVHVLGYYNDFYSIYWEDKGFGSVHMANYGDKLGMKYFLWSQARSGSIWEDLLTDTDGQYVEMQSGRMFSQPNHASAYTPFKHTAFQPQATDMWTEYWYPIKNTRGIVKSSIVGALNVVREDGQLKLYFSPLQKLDTEMRIYANDQLVATLPLQAEVLETWEKSIPATGDFAKAGKLRVIIGDEDLVYSELPEDNVTERPLETPADFDWESAYGLYLMGEQWMNQKKYVEAEESLCKSLTKEPYCVPDLQLLASICWREGRYEEGLEFCRKALSINTYDGTINYVYGLCNQALGNNIVAKEGFSMATRDMSVRSAAYEKLAEMYLIDGDWKKTEEFALKSLETNTHNLSTQRLLAALYRKSNQPEKGKAILATILKEAPLYHPARYEDYLAGELTKSEFTGGITTESAQEVYVELASWYEVIHAYDEAIELLLCAKDYPIANYRRAYDLHLQGNGNEAMAALELANGQSAALVYPHRPSTLPALIWANTQLPSWKANYYQALIYYGNQQTRKAIELLNTCNGADFAPLFLTRASMKTGEKKLADLKQAEKLDKSWRAGLALIDYHLSVGQSITACQTGKQYVKLYPDNYYIGLKYAQALCSDEQFATCITFLKKLQVLPYEGSKAGREIYRSAYLSQAIDMMKAKKYSAALKSIDQSKLWPENIGVGKPYEDKIDARMEDYLEAQIMLKKGDKQKANELLEKVTSIPSSQKEICAADALAAIALRDLGKTKEAEQLVSSWNNNSPENQMVRWIKAVYAGTQINKALPEKSDDPDLALIVRLLAK